MARAITMGWQWNNQTRESTKMWRRKIRAVCVIGMCAGLAAMAGVALLGANQAESRLGDAGGSAALASGFTGPLGSLAVLPDYKVARATSADPSGGNADGRQDKPIAPGETRVMAELSGPGAIHHIWVTIASGDPAHLRNLVFRLYWDGEETPSVLAPIGDFFGTGHGEYTSYAALPMAVAAQKSMHCWWLMPYANGAKVTVENQGTVPVGAFYFHVDYRIYKSPAQVAGTGRFHAHYRQEHPTEGFKPPGADQFKPEVNGKPNLDGASNYVLMEAEGRGVYLGAVQHILQTDDQWWGEGDDMIFIDGSPVPTLQGTGSEDYYGGAWCYGVPFSDPFLGNPRNGWTPGEGQSPPCDPRSALHRKGAKWTVYRFHVADPVPFEKSIRVTIEHGHANCRSDHVSSVAYWYQTGRSRALPELPPPATRLPRVEAGAAGQ
jgi:hypothetical protein